MRPSRPRTFVDNFEKPQDALITAHFGDKRTLNAKKTQRRARPRWVDRADDRAANDGRW